MKAEELEIMHQFNAYCINEPNSYLKQHPYEMSRFDAYNEHLTVEIKDRAGVYDGNMLIEFDKFAYNLLFSQIHNKTFIYLNRAGSNLYVWDINYLDSIDYAFNWHWKRLPKTSRFEDNAPVEKFVGYVNIRDSDVIEMIEPICPN